MTEPARTRTIGEARTPAREEPDEQSCTFSEATGLLFGVNARGNWAELIDAESGERLLSSLEEQEGRLRAEEGLRRETKARKIADVEIVRLRQELKRLRDSPR